MNTLLLVDVSNIYYCLMHQFNSKLDYHKLISMLREKGHVFGHKIAYATGSGGQDVFLRTLEHLGFEIKVKERTAEGANLDSEIVADAVRLSKDFDSIVLVSGDGDFAHCLELLKDKNHLVVVGSSISGKLKLHAHEAYEITGNLFYQQHQMVEP